MSEQNRRAAATERARWLARRGERPPSSLLASSADREALPTRSRAAVPVGARRTRRGRDAPPKKRTTSVRKEIHNGLRCLTRASWAPGCGICVRGV